MKSKTKREWDDKRFDYSDRMMAKALKEVNLAFEKSKPNYRRTANRKIATMKKIDYKGISFTDSDFQKISDTLYIDEINDIIVKYQLDVANHYYDVALKEAKALFPDDRRKQKKKARELSASMIRKWNENYVRGIKSSYMQNARLQSAYMSFRIANALNDGVRDITSADEKKDTMRDRLLNMNALPVLLAYKLQKKKMSNAIDNAFAHIVGQATMTAYIDMGLEYVVRVAELDERTCEECEELDGEIYPIDEAPDVMLHSFCRCYYLPLSDIE